MKNSDDYLWDRSGDPDPDVARLEDLLSPLCHDAPLDELRARRPRRTWIVVTTLAVAAAVALIAWWRWPRAGEAPPQLACAGSAGFSFTAKGGDVACNGAEVATGVLPIDGVLDTGAHEAELAIANIGTAQLGAKTRVRLQRTDASRHQLYLERGTMHARVDAPPRIFAVATPSGDVTDLGCEYTLEIGADGGGRIHVLSGKVELEATNGSRVVAPQGTHAKLLPGRRASVPLADSAGDAIAKAVDEFDAGTPDGLAHVLAAATRDDAITVASLARMVPAAQRRSVLEKLQTLVPAPQDLTIDEALADDDLFEMWFIEVELVHLGASR